MARMFGTDGVRGVAGTELTIELAMKLGQAMYESAQAEQGGEEAADARAEDDDVVDADFEEINIDERPEKIDYVKSLGFTAAPVIEAGDIVFSGFQPTKLKEIL